MADHIFISYSHKDEQFVFKLKADLEARGFEVWIDQDDIKVGEAWMKGIVQAIRDCVAFVVVLSMNSNTSEHVQTELALASKNKKRIIPIKIEDVPQFSEDIEYLLARVQYLDYDPEDYKRIIVRLVEQLLSLSPLNKFNAVKEERTSNSKPASLIIGESNLEPTILASEKFTKIDESSLKISESKENPPKVIDISKPVEMKFMLIEKGTFLMGSLTENLQAFEDEMPQYRQAISYDYWLARTPVTNAQFQCFIDSTRRQHRWVEGWQQKLDHPVVNVSLKSAQDFCGWLTEKAMDSLPIGFICRLPSEAEWEKAARGTDGREYPWGNTWETEHCNSEETGIKSTTSVAKYSPVGDSPYGIADMAGNIWEWTCSLWGISREKPSYGYPYQRSDGRENEQAGDTIRRVVRGGSWLYNQRVVRCAFRGRTFPTRFDNNLGFRVVLSMDIHRSWS